ncbi:hypothetical protein [Streptomyces akebiae]|uniref:Uncharacterized protein n=1 Tax=Streptomyces akebiae TaxID=2865673 RepID=A0ABX8XQQ8_9ACTN|nr:hypothetical protein [Streptomyces akebiae]QYX77953.1 hypothetical protein K1J60_16695 [Streptomyces akebiae]
MLRRDDDRLNDTTTAHGNGGCGCGCGCGCGEVSGPSRTAAAAASGLAGQRPPLFLGPFTPLRFHPAVVARKDLT